MGDPKKISFLKAFALLSQLGLTIALPIFSGVLLGSHLDERLEGGGIYTIILMILGVLGGLMGAYQLIMNTIGPGRKKD